MGGIHNEIIRKILKMTSHFEFLDHWSELKDKGDMEKESLADFSNNLAHITSGLSITTLPIAMEIVEMSDGAISSVSTDNSTPSNHNGTHIEKQTLVKPLEPAPKPAKSTAEQLQEIQNKPGLLASIWLWINTPKGVSWHDIRQGRWKA